MGSFVCDTNLSLALGSETNSFGKSSEKEQDEEVNNHLLLDLNLAPGEQSTKNCSSDECENNENNNITGSRKKLRLSIEQSSILEESFKEHNILNFEQKNSLATQLNLLPRQVEVWFQNRRARTKLKLIETDSKHWKKSYEDLAVENERLKQELEMVNFQASKRAKLDAYGSSNSAVPMNENGEIVCPNCHHHLSMIKNNMSTGGNRPAAILKPTAKHGGVNISRI